MPTENDGELLTPIRSSYTNSLDLGPRPQSVAISDEALKTTSEQTAVITAINDPESAIAALKSSLSLRQLSNVLTYLSSTSNDSNVSPNKSQLSYSNNNSNIHTPSPVTSRLVNVLLTDVIPNFWAVLISSPSHKKDVNALLYCLRSVTGIGGIVARLRGLAAVTADKNELLLRDILDVLSRVLKGRKTLLDILRQVYDDDEQNHGPKRDIIWKELVGIIASGKVLSAAAEGVMVIGDIGDEKEQWVGDGKRYASWLGRNISAVVAALDIAGDDDRSKALGLVLSKSLSLGYSAEIVDRRLVLDFDDESLEYFSRLRRLLNVVPPHDKRQYVNNTLRLLSKTHLANHDRDPPSDVIAGAAGVISALLYAGKDEVDETTQSVLVEWITGSGSSGAGEPIGIRRAIIAVLAKSSLAMVTLHEVLEKLVTEFGDKLWIRHASIVQQEVNVQCLLLSAGYVHREPPSYLTLLVRSSSYLQGISNRIASTDTKVRFLGMIVGEAVSKLVDKDSNNNLKFSGLEDMEGVEADWWADLVNIKDEVGDVKLLARERKPAKRRVKNLSQKPTLLAPKIEEVDDDLPGTPTILHGRIEEVITSESDDDDLVPYAKPDSDPDDSDEDPTLVRRKKDAPPVYIRDLLYMIHSHESYDKQEMALQHATILIRRKAHFGTEVTSHLVQLLESFIGLHDKFDITDFDSLRMKAVVALVAMHPVDAGQWIARRVFDGEWSLNQRCVMLSAIGLAALEISGDKSIDDNDINLSPAEKQTAAFPSKRLPKRLHDVYTTTPIDSLSSRLQSTMIQPLASNAAETLSGPAVLKVRKFSSKPAVQARLKPPSANPLSKIVDRAFFVPLLNGWSVYLQDYGYSTPILNPHLLSLFLKTLSVVMHAAGPFCPSLPSITMSYWDLLLSLRHNNLTQTSTVLDAILLGFLALLDINSEDGAKRRLAEQQGKELMETQSWVSDVFDGRVKNSGEGAGEQRQALAAAVLVKCREVMERYERLLVGEMI